MKIDKSLLSGSTTLLVLSLLRGGDMYGYEMISELSRRSDRTFELKEGTLYPILHGLELLEQKQEEWRFFTGKVNGVVFGDALAPA